MKCSSDYITADEALEAVKNGATLRAELRVGGFGCDYFLDHPHYGQIGKLYHYTYLLHFQNFPRTASRGAN